MDFQLKETKRTAKSVYYVSEEPVDFTLKQKKEQQIVFDLPDSGNSTVHLELELPYVTKSDLRASIGATLKGDNNSTNMCVVIKAAIEKEETLSITLNQTFDKGEKQAIFILECAVSDLDISKATIEELIITDNSSGSLRDFLYGE